MKRSMSTGFLALAWLLLSGCSERQHDVSLQEAPRLVLVAPTSSAAPSPVVVPVASTKPTAEVSVGKVAPAPKAHGSALTLRRLVVGTGVERTTREPVGVAPSFTKGDFEKLVAFVELSNPGEQAEVVVSFEPPSKGPHRGNVTLEVGASPRWRTWASSKGITERGEWAAVVKTTDGRELGRETFQVL